VTSNAQASQALVQYIVDQMARSTWKLENSMSTCRARASSNSFTAAVARAERTAAAASLSRGKDGMALVSSAV
jgi:hypothetical protein